MEAVEQGQETPMTPPPGTETPPPAVETPPAGAFSKQSSLLARKEQALQRDRAALKAERAAFDAERAKIAAATPPPPRPKSPLESMNEAMTPQELALATKAELKAFREEQEAAQKKAADDAKVASEATAAQVIQDFKADIGEYLKSKPDDYELIALNEAEHLVYDTIEENYATKKEVLTIKAASDLVEAYLERRHKAIIEKSKKLKAAPPIAAPVESSKSPAPTRTLNNGMTAQTPTLLVNNSTQDAAFQRALKALGG